MTTTLTYTTIYKLNEYLGQVGYAPSWSADAKPTGKSYETVGTGDVSTTIFYTNNKNIIDSTYTFYYGLTTSATTALTETTHYSIDLDQGVITLTGTGVTVVGTANIYGIYKYNIAGLPNSLISNTLVRAQNVIERECETLFVDGTSATPAYGVAYQELQRGRGQYDRWYFTDKYPIQVIVTQLNGDLTAAATTIVVDSTNGFASSGTAVIESEQFSYTTKTSTAFMYCTRGENSTTAAAHDDNTYVTRHIVEYSLTEAGSEPTWETLDYMKDYSIDADSGRIKLLNFDLLRTAVLNNKFPVEDLPDRVRLSYPYGWNVIPEEIELCTLMIASKQLLNQTVSRSLIQGRDEFRPQMLTVDDAWINSIKERYTSIKVSRP